MLNAFLLHLKDSIRVHRGWVGCQSREAYRGVDEHVINHNWRTHSVSACPQETLSREHCGACLSERAETNVKRLQYL